MDKIVKVCYYVPLRVFLAIARSQRMGKFFQGDNVNPSQVLDHRFYRRWERSGALSTIHGPVPSARQILEHLSDENYRHMVEISRIMYAIQWLPDAVLAMDGISREEVKRQTIYWQIGLLYRVSNTESIHGLFPQGMMLAEINRLLEEVEMEDFRTADDSLSRSHPELQLGEVWLTNDDDEGWEYIGYQYKRRGNTAYDCWHKRVDSLFPIFVHKVEYEANRTPDATAHG